MTRERKMAKHNGQNLLYIPILTKRMCKHDSKKIVHINYFDAKLKANAHHHE